MRYALCPMPYALCPMPYALYQACTALLLRKAILLGKTALDFPSKLIDATPKSSMAYKGRLPWSKYTICSGSNPPVAITYGLDKMENQLLLW